MSGHMNIVKITVIIALIYIRLKIKVGKEMEDLVKVDWFQQVVKLWISIQVGGKFF